MYQNALNILNTLEMTHVALHSLIRIRCTQNATYNRGEETSGGFHPKMQNIHVSSEMILEEVSTVQLNIFWSIFVISFLLKFLYHAVSLSCHVPYHIMHHLLM